MAVTDTDTVDGLGLTKDGNGLMLLIADHLDWTREHSHLLTLQTKINAYLRFIESGQYKEVYTTLDTPISYYTIEIHFKYAPTLNCKRFLETVSQAVSAHNIFIRTEDVHS